VNQGWKDSHDCISHKNGELLKGPIALCEVQGYVYQAKLAAARLARRMGRAQMGDELQFQAETLKRKFNEVFWDPKKEFIAIALDGKKKPARVLSSNPGHCLATEIIAPGFAAIVAKKLMSEELYSGWRIRTLGCREKRFNPMSYHNGSVWPHDTSLAAMGLATYGYSDSVVKICEDLFEASSYFDMQRVPELFCGFERRKDDGPTLYPVACSPQAWAVASVFLLIQSLLGIEIWAEKKEVCLKKSLLPKFLNELEVRHISLGDGRLSLRFIRYGVDTGVEVLEKPRDWKLMIYK
jgi:glycogen debranching enzyme